MALYCTINTERIKSLCGKNAELLLLKLAIYIVTTGLSRSE